MTTLECGYIGLKGGLEKKENQEWVVLPINIIAVVMGRRSVVLHQRDFIHLARQQ
jgi:hypothetical protein